jgi:hypothetical protein
MAYFSSDSLAASLLPHRALLAINAVPCGQFVGLKFNRRKGRFDIRWNITMLLTELSGVAKWSGGAVWGSQPSIDVVGNRVFVASGNTYAVPESYTKSLGENKDAEKDDFLPHSQYLLSTLTLDTLAGFAKSRR